MSRTFLRNTSTFGFAAILFSMRMAKTQRGAYSKVKQ